MTRLSVRSRLLSIVAAMMLMAVFFVPLWRIQLLAPQYPEGLGMLIKVNTITGIAPTDLNNINGLNHYIGMKAIHADAIPVLTYMPWVVGFLVLCGLATALVGRRALLIGWLAAFGIAGLAGLAEFFLWSYDYGHNLAEDAVIKVPGMTYQPPLIGSKQLLNFTASSWPDIGGILAAVAFLVAAAALISPGAVARLRRARSLKAAVVATFGIALAASGCGGTKPIALSIGRADCHTCHMRIVDNRFGGVVVSFTGKVREFDSIGCLTNYVAASVSDSSGATAWVSDFDHPGVLILAATAQFVRGGVSGQSMRDGLIAISPGAAAESLRARFGSGPMTWREVLALPVHGPTGAANND